MPWHSKVGIWTQYVIYGVILIVVALLFIVPEDIFTSALFVDTVGIRPAFASPTMWFGPEAPVYATQQGVSRGAFGVSLMLFFVQMVLSFIAWTETRFWFRTNRSEAKSFMEAVVVLGRVLRKRENVREFSYARLGIVGAWWLMVFLDTYADAHFRSWGRTSAGVFTTPEELWGFSLIFSFVVYTIGSELLLTLAFRMITTGVTGMLADRGQTTAEFAQGLLNNVSDLVNPKVGGSTRSGRQEPLQRSNDTRQGGRNR